MNRKGLHIAIIICMLAYGQKSTSWNMYSFDKNVFVGNIIFPQNVKSIPQISLYRRGIKIKSETDHDANKTQFTISEDKTCNEFYLLITQNVKANVKDNTVHNLAIDLNQNYKFYKIQMIQINGAPRHPLAEKNTDEKDEFAWQIASLNMHKDGVLPDNTLIIIFNPEYVEKLEGGNDLELPKIIIKKNILELAGSQEKLLVEADALIMGSLDFLTLSHIKPKPEIKLQAEKKLIMVMSNPADLS